MKESKEHKIETEISRIIIVVIVKLPVFLFKLLFNYKLQLG